MENKLIEKRCLQAEVKMLEREYKNLQEQIRILKLGLGIVEATLKQKLDKIQAIEEEHSIIEYKYLSDNNK